MFVKKIWNSSMFYLKDNILKIIKNVRDIVENLKNIISRDIPILLRKSLPMNSILFLILLMFLEWKQY